MYLNILCLDLCPLDMTLVHLTSIIMGHKIGCYILGVMLLPYLCHYTIGTLSRKGLVLSVENLDRDI